MSPDLTELKWKRLLVHIHAWIILYCAYTIGSKQLSSINIHLQPMVTPCGDSTGCSLGPMHMNDWVSSHILLQRNLFNMVVDFPDAHFDISGIYVLRNQLYERSINQSKGVSADVPIRCQVITLTSVGLLSTRPLGTTVSEIQIKIKAYPFKKMYLK